MQRACSSLVIVCVFLFTMAAAASFGLYLGNTSACLAIYKDDNVDVVANNAGDRVTAAVVAFNDSEKIIGLAAKAGLFRNAAVSVIHNKRLMNKDIDPAELESAMKSSSSKLINDSQRLHYSIKRGEKNEKITPADISTILFEAMYDISTTAAHDDEEHNVVLCTPLRFSPESIKGWSRSAEAAGFKVLQNVSEPTATCLAHGIGKDKKKTELVLVYRIGGVTSEVTLIKVVGGAYVILATNYYPALGGNKLTQLLTKYLGNEFSNKYKLDPTESRRSISKLNTEADKCKHILSTMSSAHCFVESLYDGVDFSYNISRARFENLIGPCISEYVAPIDDILRATEHTPEDIDKIILAGGTMKIPKLQEKIGALFPNGEVLTSRWSPDETMAIGAAIQSSILLSHGMYDRELNSSNVELHCLDKAIGVQFDDLEPIIIPEGTIVPIKISTNLDVPKSTEGKTKVQIFERPSKEDGVSKKIGLISLNTNGGKLKVDTDLTEASLNVHITDISTNKKSSFRFGIHEDDS